MEILVVIFIIVGFLSIYDAIRKLNSNIVTQIDQNDRIIELLKEIQKNKNHNSEGR